MQPLKQAREDTRVRIYTSEYRIYGHMHLVPGRSTAELLNLEQREVVPITQVQLFTPGWVHPPQESELRGRVQFMGLNRDRILWVLGGRQTVLKGATFKEARLSLVFPGLLLSGDAQIPSGARITDFLYSSRQFGCMTNVSLCPLEEDRPLTEVVARSRFEFVTVNFRQAVGVFEG